MISPAIDCGAGLVECLASTCPPHACRRAHQETRHHGNPFAGSGAAVLLPILRMPTTRSSSTRRAPTTTRCAPTPDTVLGLVMRGVVGSCDILLHTRVSAFQNLGGRIVAELIQQATCKEDPIMRFANHGFSLWAMYGSYSATGFRAVVISSLGCTGIAKTSIQTPPVDSTLSCVLWIMGTFAGLRRACTLQRDSALSRSAPVDAQASRRLTRGMEDEHGNALRIEMAGSLLRTGDGRSGRLGWPCSPPLLPSHLSKGLPRDALSPVEGGKGTGRGMSTGMGNGVGTGMRKVRARV